MNGLCGHLVIRRGSEILGVFRAIGWKLLGSKHNNTFGKLDQWHMSRFLQRAVSAITIQTWRFALSASTAISVVLVVAITIAWMRSYWAADQVELAQVTRDIAGGTVLLATAGYEAGRFIADWERPVEPSTAALRRMFDMLNMSHRPPIQVQFGLKSVRWFTFGGRDKPVRNFSRLGLEVSTFMPWSEDLDYPYPAVHVTIPLWMLELIFLPLPFWSIVKKRRLRRELRRKMNGQCGSCGYDLRASAGRCSECGMEIGESSIISSRKNGATARVAACVTPFLIVASLYWSAYALIDQQAVLRKQFKAVEILAYPFHNAVGSGDSIRARLLLDHGADANEDGQLHFAAGAGDLEMVKLLLGRGAVIDRIDGGRGPSLPARTPLAEAVFFGRWDVAKLLLDRGADWKKIGWEEAMIILLWHPQLRYANRIKEANAQSEDGISLLMLASSWGDASILSELLHCGAKVEVADAQGRTPLHRAALTANASCIRLLLEAGANVNAKDKSGLTPLGLAHSEDTEVLLSQYGGIATKPLPHRYVNSDKLDFLRSTWPDKIVEYGFGSHGYAPSTLPSQGKSTPRVGPPASQP